MWKVIFQYFRFSLKITTTTFLRMHHQRMVRHAAVPRSATRYTLRTEIKLGDQPQTEDEMTVVPINLGPEACDGTKYILGLKEGKKMHFKFSWIVGLVLHRYCCLYLHNFKV